MQWCWHYKKGPQRETVTAFSLKYTVSQAIICHNQLVLCVPCHDKCCQHHLWFLRTLNQIVICYVLLSGFPFKMPYFHHPVALSVLPDTQRILSYCSWNSSVLVFLYYVTRFVMLLCILCLLFRILKSVINKLFHYAPETSELYFNNIFSSTLLCILRG